jgi:hypothetical protein
MSDEWSGQGGRTEDGPLTAITAVQVEVRLEQLVAEAISWAERLQDLNPAPVVSLSGTLGDFDPDPDTIGKKRVYALRVLDVDETVVGTIRAQVQEALRNNCIGLSASAPHTVRIQAQTIQEAGRSHWAVRVRFECLQAVRLRQEPPLESAVVIWAAERVSWGAVAQPGWPVLYLEGVLDPLLREFYRQKPGSWFRERAADFPAGVPDPSKGGFS